MCTLLSIFFLGGWSAPFYWISFSFWFGLKISFFAFCFVWLRASYPRYRYDQLMQLGWKSFLPVSIGLVIVVISFLITCDGLPSIII